MNTNPIIPIKISKLIIGVHPISIWSLEYCSLLKYFFLINLIEKITPTRMMIKGNSIPMVVDKIARGLELASLMNTKMIKRRITVFNQKKVFSILLKI